MYKVSESFQICLKRPFTCFMPVPSPAHFFQQGPIISLCSFCGLYLPSQQALLPDQLLSSITGPFQMSCLSVKGMFPGPLLPLAFQPGTAEKVSLS